MTRRYHEYLASREWALKREAVRERSGNKCERCKVNAQDAVHHLSYEHIYDEPLEDLMPICDPCHAFLSAKSEVDPAVTDPTTRATTDAMARRDAALIISIRREIKCACCRMDTLGDYILCKSCDRPACIACRYKVGDEWRCVDHAETA